jgi:hypothetical protein
MYCPCLRGVIDRELWRYTVLILHVTRPIHFHMRLMVCVKELF